MKCPNCRQSMRPMLVSVVCDYCDGIEQHPAPFVGYIVHYDKYTMPYRAYVFSAPRHAQRWLDLRGSEGAEVRRVQSTHMFSWRNGVGPTSDLEFADTLCEIHADRRHEPGQHVAHLWGG